MTEMEDNFPCTRIFMSITYPHETTKNRTLFTPNVDNVCGQKI